MAAPINDFGFRLLHQLTDGKDKNVMVSPLSVSLALAMTYNGAAAETKSAIAKTLGVASLSDETINRNNHLLIDTLAKADPAVQMEIANALWAQSGFPISPDFLKVNHDYYDAPVESLDFEGNRQKALGTINGWINEKTHAKIPKIFDQLDDGTVLVLTDAVYFKGGWAVPFDPKKTEQRKFHLHAGTIDVPMMIRDGEEDEYLYFENELFQAIRLTYGDNRFAMTIFLPRKTNGLPDLLSKLDASQWSDWSSKLRRRKGQIVLPRFEANYSQKLNGSLSSMGMSVAFSRRADFSRIHPPPPELLISDVEHKTYIKVDEEGTEAAAATGVSVGLMMATQEPPPFDMVVDHPFFCAITESQSGALLFAGVITDPAQH